MSKTAEKTYWRSLQELSESKVYQEYATQEFPDGAGELKDGFSRRNFLQIMGASIALAGFTACRKPVQKLLPYTRQPENVVAGIPLTYASTIPFMDSAIGVLVTTNEGRPTKIEGNPDHPSSMGATNLFMQASILDLYDVDRSKSPTQNGDSRNWNDFIAFASEHFADTNKRIAFVSEASSSPTFNRLKRQVLSRFPNAKWATWEPAGNSNVYVGTELAFGSKLRPVNHFDKAKVVVSLDFDFMNSNGDTVDSNIHFANGRRVSSVESEMNRLYVVENSMSLTGSNADHRLRIKASEMPSFVAALAAQLSGSLSGLNAYSGISNDFSQHSWISVLAEELLQNRGTSIIAAGQGYAPEVHATVAAINAALGNAVESVTYHEVPFVDDSYNNDTFVEMCNELSAGDYDTLIVVGGNPVFNAPSDVNFAQIMEQIPTSIHLSTHVNETSKRSTWHVNRAHYLEFWGDATSKTGVRSIVQPTILPLWGGKSEIEFLAAIATGENHEGYDLVQETWTGVISGEFVSGWNQTIHDGLQIDSGFSAISVSLTNLNTVAESLAAMRAASGIEFVLKPDNKVFDGRFANNGWLMELPDPITKITWDNVALMSPATARSLGVEQKKFGVTDFDMISISVNGVEIEMAAWILPGHADDSITTQLGYGNTSFGRVADDMGQNTYRLRSSENMLYHTDANVRKISRSYPIACTQNHNQMEGRPIVREATLAEYREKPDFAPRMVYVPGRQEDGKPINLHSTQTFPDYQPQWGMAIDLNSCTGCGVCTIACQSENNIPVIGKREVVRNREMHWIRTDRYYNGDEENPQVVHQPIPCMHCEQAPCELVCPVAATTHSDDGLNQMTYNQCVGTRYCSNNCPFKVRRFNFFNYAKNWLEIDEDPDVIQMAMNPDVSIRFRGVMEKCTYCVQRISRAKIETKNRTGNSIKPEDGAVVTACQQACPTQAITFGDITDSNSVISKNKANERNYVLLEEINVRPRTSYLAKLRNPNSQLV